MDDFKRILSILTESSFDRNIHSMNRDQIEQLAEDATNIAIKHIQDFLNVETGDFASRFFSGSRYDMMVNILSRYIKEELSNPQD